MSIEWHTLRPLSRHLQDPAAFEMLVEFVASEEGFREDAYKCPAGVWTIGYGFTDGVKEGDKISRSEADARLADELQRVGREMDRIVQVNISAGQFVALLSLAYNVGAGKLAKYALIQALNFGDVEAASDEFLDINRAGGVVLEGLTKRRQRERRLFVEGNTIAQCREVLSEILGL